MNPMQFWVQLAEQWQKAWAGGMGVSIGASEIDHQGVCVLNIVYSGRPGVHFHHVHFHEPEKSGQAVDPHAYPFAAFFSMRNWCRASGTGGSGPLW
jgi:hypothetical protein